MAKKCEKILANDTNTVRMHLCRDGYYLWSDSVKHNIAMHEPSERAAFMAGIKSLERQLMLYMDLAEQRQKKIDAVLAALGAEEINEEDQRWLKSYR